LSEILPRHYTEPGGDHLHEDSHQAGKPDHPKEPLHKSQIHSRVE